MSYRMSKRELYPHIESVLVRPDITEEDIKKLCSEAKDHSFAAVMVNPLHVKLCKKLLNSNTYKIRVCTPVGFPYGEQSIAAKLQAAKTAFSEGADEVDVHVCISAIKAGKWDYIKKEFQKLIALNRKRVVKFVVDTKYLNSDEIMSLCELAVNVKARFVVIGSAFSPNEIDVEELLLIRETVSNTLRVRGDDFFPCDIKVCGKVLDLDEAINIVSMGIKRMGLFNMQELIKNSSNREVLTRPIPPINRNMVTDDSDQQEIRLTPPITSQPRINTDEKNEQLELVYTDEDE